jgi:hypothetical protein
LTKASSPAVAKAGGNPVDRELDGAQNLLIRRRRTIFIISLI